MKNFKNRLNSDKAESLTVSQILWIVFTVLVVISVTTMIAKTIGNKSREMDKRITDADGDVQGAFDGTKKP